MGGTITQKTKGRVKERPKDAATGTKDGRELVSLFAGDSGMLLCTA
jgi:hypothetical protein